MHIVNTNAGYIMEAILANLEQLDIRQQMTLTKHNHLQPFNEQMDYLNFFSVKFVSCEKGRQICTTVTGCCVALKSSIYCWRYSPMLIVVSD